MTGRFGSGESVGRLDLGLNGLAFSNGGGSAAEVAWRCTISWRHVSRKLESLNPTTNDRNSLKHAVARSSIARNPAGLGAGSKQYWESIAGCH